MSDGRTQITPDGRNERSSSVFAFLRRKAMWYEWCVRRTYYRVRYFRDRRAARRRVDADFRAFYISHGFPDPPERWWKG